MKREIDEMHEDERAKVERRKLETSSLHVVIPRYVSVLEMSCQTRRIAMKKYPSNNPPRKSEKHSSMIRCVALLTHQHRFCKEFR